MPPAPAALHCKIRIRGAAAREERAGASVRARAAVGRPSTVGRHALSATCTQGRDTVCLSSSTPPLHQPPLGLRQSALLHTLPPQVEFEAVAEEIRPVHGVRCAHFTQQRRLDTIQFTLHTRLP